ncbi:MAG TPA: hypothetical protein VG265_08220 [Gaiellaceae bacterium]|nr:hypothetical protein [Gaiellaceae bacterium]
MSSRASQATRRVVLFDLDNTLIDRQAAFRAWASGFLLEHGLREFELAWLETIDEDGFKPRELFFAEVKRRFRLCGAGDEPPRGRARRARRRLGGLGHRGHPEAGATVVRDRRPRLRRLARGRVDGGRSPRRRHRGRNRRRAARCLDRPGRTWLEDRYEPDATTETIAQAVRAISSLDR